MNPQWLATAEQSRALDESAMREYALTQEVLMESAGVGAAKELSTAFFPELRRGNVIVVCGPGNNGADGLVVARHLSSMGVQNVSVYAADSASEIFLNQKKRTHLSGVPICSLEEFRVSEQVSLVIDALFGVGLNRDIETSYRTVVELLNGGPRRKHRVVSLDVPSGLCPNHGTWRACGVKADMTISFGLMKPGFFINQGPQSAGMLRLVNIGIATDLKKKVAKTHLLFEASRAKSLLPGRENASNKSHFGRSYIVAGQPGMWGAAMLASQAAYRAGVGYVTLVNDELPLQDHAQVPEILTSSFSKVDFSAAKSVAIGPGAGDCQDHLETFRQLDCPVVVDADALKDYRAGMLRNAVLTPHSGELSRLIDKDASWIDSHRFDALKMAYDKFQCPILLKGFRTVVFDGEKNYIINSGNPALAKAGTGDVLTGLIAGYAAQMNSLVEASCLGAYVHGHIADRFVSMGKDVTSLLASELLQLLPDSIAQIRGERVF